VALMSDTFTRRIWAMIFENFPQGALGTTNVLMGRRYYVWL